jgi:hypothetical protein
MGDLLIDEHLLPSSQAGNPTSHAIELHQPKYRMLSNAPQQMSMDDSASRGYVSLRLYDRITGVDLGPLPLPVCGLGGRNLLEAREVG